MSIGKRFSIVFGFAASFLMATMAASAESEQDAFQGEISAALRDGRPDALARASCRQPPRGAVLSTARHPFPENHATIGPVPKPGPGESKAVRERMRAFAGAEFEISLCFEPLTTKQMCLTAPVKRRDGKLCID